MSARALGTSGTKITVWQFLAGRPLHEFGLPEGVTSYVARSNQSPFFLRSCRARSTATGELPIGAHTARTHASASSETGIGAIALSPEYSLRASSLSSTSRAFAAWRPIFNARLASSTSTRGGPAVALDFHGGDRRFEHDGDHFVAESLTNPAQPQPTRSGLVQPELPLRTKQSAGDVNRVRSPDADNRDCTTTFRS